MGEMVTMLVVRAVSPTSIEASICWIRFCSFFCGRISKNHITPITTSQRTSIVTISPMIINSNILVWRDGKLWI